MGYILEERQREEAGAHLYGIPRAYPGQRQNLLDRHLQKQRKADVLGWMEND